MIGVKPVPSIKARALRLLATREYSRAELEGKLSRHLGPEEDPAALTQALDELAAKGFIDEARVAESVLHRRAGRLGATRVLQELRAKGLSEDLIEASADRLRATELERARAIWRKKFGALPRDAAERARQLRFLAARGFATGVALKAIDGSGH